MKNKKLKIAIFAFVMLVSVIGITAAYFISSANNRLSNETRISTGTTILVLEDVDPITREDQISPNNTSITRYLTIHNEGSVDGYAKLLFKNLVNTFVLDDLTYTLEEVNSDKSSLSTPNIIVDNGVVPKSDSASNIELTDGLLISSNTSKYYKLTVSYDYKTDTNQDADLNKVMTCGFIIEEGKRINKIYCVDESNNEVDCPSTFTIGDRIAIGRDTPQYFRYFRTTTTSGNLNECGGTTSIRCGDQVDGEYRFLAEYNLKRTGDATTDSAIDPNALQDPSDSENANSVQFGANGDYNYSYIKTYFNNYAVLLNNLIDESNAIIVNGMTLYEATGIFGCQDRKKCTTSASWAYNSAYWLITSRTSKYVYRLGNGILNDYHYSYYQDNGVRPVIQINPSIIR